MQTNGITHNDTLYRSAQVVARQVEKIREGVAVLSKDWERDVLRNAFGANTSLLSDAMEKKPQPDLSFGQCKQEEVRQTDRSKGQVAS